MKSIMMNVREKFNRTFAKQYALLSLAAMTLLPAAVSAQQNNAEEKADTTKILPAWTNELDSVHKATPATAVYSDFIDNTMTVRGYSTDSRNNLTAIAAEDLITRGPAKYKEYLKNAGNDMTSAVKSLRLAALDNEDTRKETYKDLINLHVRDLKNNGTIKAIRDDLASGSKSVIVNSWKSKTELDKYLPAEIVLKQLGNSTNISNILSADSASFNQLSLDNLAGTAAAHVGPTGTKNLVNLLRTGKGGDKLNAHFPQKTVNTLVSKCLLSYQDAIGEAGMNDLKQNITVAGFFNALTLRSAEENKVNIPVSIPEKEVEKHAVFLNIMLHNKTVNLTVEQNEKTVLSPALSVFGGFDQRYSTLGGNDYFQMTKGYDDTGVTYNTASVGVAFRLVNSIKEQEQGKERPVHVFGHLAVGYGTADNSINIAPEKIERAADNYGVTTDFFNDVKSFKANYVRPELELGLQVGPFSYAYNLASYHTTGFGDLSQYQAYAMHPTTFIGTHKAKANLLNVTGDKWGTTTLTAVIEAADVNMWVNNSTPISADGTASGSAQNDFLFEQSKEDILTAYKLKSLNLPRSSWNSFGAEVTHQTPNNRFEFSAGVKASAYNGGGDGTVIGYAEKSLKNLINPSDWQNPQLSFSIKFNLTGAKEKKTVLSRSYSENTAFIGKRAFYQNKAEIQKPVTFEQKGKLKHIRARSMVNIGR